MPEEHTVSFTQHHRAKSSRSYKPGQYFCQTMDVEPPPAGIISDDTLLLLDTLALDYFSQEEAEPEEDEHPGACPLCGWKLGGEGHVVEREGPYGPFWGCSNYPKCRYTKSKGRRDNTLTQEVLDFLLSEVIAHKLAST